MKKENCYYCNLEYEKIKLKKNQKAYCKRCNSLLYEYVKNDEFFYAFIYALTSLILFFVSNIYPIMSFELNEIHYTTSFFEASFRLYELDYSFLSITVFLTAIIFPVILLSSIIFIYFHSRGYFNFFHRNDIIKLYLVARSTSFSEVFLLALVVAYVKLSDISIVIVHDTIYPFIFSILFMLLAIRKVHITTKVNTQNINNSFNISLSLVITALILYIPANILPMMNISKFGVITSDTIFSGIVSLYDNGMFPIAAIVFIASIVIPLFKLLGMLFILLSIKYSFFDKPQFKLTLFKIVDVIGKWSILDIYMIALLVVLVQDESLAYVEPGIASIFFAMVIFITMLSTAAFDTKMIWKKNE